MGKKLLAALAAIALMVGVGFALSARPFPSDQTPAGAYMRIAKSVGEDAPRAIFAYLETDAQWACYTIRDARSKALARVEASYPPTERAALESAYRAQAAAPDGADVFTLEAARRGWLARLRKDLSGVASVQIDGDRASVVTARGTRYPFRRRDNGIWGLTIFTADLVAESERAARDLSAINAAADDFERARRR